MKIKLFTIVLIAFVAAVGFYTLKPKDKLTKEQVIISSVFQTTKTYHYLNLKIDDAFSKKAFNQYLKSIDYNKKILLKSDVEALKKFELTIDDEINNTEKLNYFEASLEIIKKRENEVASIYKELLSKPFDFSVLEFLEVDVEKRDFPKSIEERKEFWRKSLKYQVLAKYHSLKNLQQGDSVKVKKNDTDLEKEAREKVSKSFEEWTKNIQQSDRMERFSVYVNALMSVYDPHTQYFAPREKEDFDIHMTGRLEGIGATLTVKDGYVKVSAIVPGSASWKQGELEVGDLIIEVAQATEKPVDVVDMRLDKVVSLIRGPKGTQVRLTVKKVDGTVKIITIVRDVVVIEETYAKSALLQLPNDNKQFGYINLPTFYADFSGQGGRNCSDDMLIEIERLANENTLGTIVDLRNNGGGSLHDCIKIVGLFIESGPVVIVDDKSGTSQSYDDPDPRIRNTKPLIVLVNGFSASASEIFAAAIQDYGRGVVMGTESTFGKGTVQRFFELDDVVTNTPEYASLKPLGAVKLTMSKFFRINGGATQLKGVVPDIVLKDAYSGMKLGEREEDFPMPWTKIKAEKYKRYSATPNLKLLVKETSKSVDTTLYFKKLNAHLELLQKEEKNTQQSLRFTDYDKELTVLEKSSEELNKISKSNTLIQVNHLKDEKESVKTDKAKKDRLEAFHKTLVKDVYLYQALLTLSKMQ